MTCPRCQQADRREGDAYCRECRQDITRAWRHQNPERARELSAAERRRAGIPPRHRREPRTDFRISLPALKKAFSAIERLDA